MATRKNPDSVAADLIRIEAHLEALSRNVAKLEAALQQHIPTMLAHDDTLVRGIERLRNDLERLDPQKTIETLREAHDSSQAKLFDLLTKHLEAQEAGKKRRDERLANLAKAIWEKGGGALVLGIVLILLGLLQQATGIQTIPGVSFKP